MLIGAVENIDTNYYKRYPVKFHSTLQNIMYNVQANADRYLPHTLALRSKCGQEISEKEIPHFWEVRFLFFWVRQQYEK